jgi:hypothetical protein
MDQQPPSQEEKDLLPLLVLAPRAPGSAEPVAKSAVGEQTTSLYRSEFGYDCRLDQGSTRPLPKVRQPRRRPSGLIAAGLIVVAAVVVMTQPGVRTALFTHQSNAPAKTAPTSTGGVLALHSTPTPAVQTQLSGSYVVGTDGSVTTTCNMGAATPGKCVWTIDHPANQTLNLQMSWTGTATLALAATDATGKSYFSNTSATSPQNAVILSAPSTLIITVSMSNTQATTFTVKATGSGS